MNQLIKNEGKCQRYLNNISNKITDLKFVKDNEAKIKLVHHDKEKLKEDIENLKVFEVVEIDELKPEKPVKQYGGYYRPHLPNSHTYKKK